MTTHYHSVFFFQIQWIVLCARHRNNLAKNSNFKKIRRRDSEIMGNDLIFHFYSVSICSGQKKTIIARCNPSTYIHTTKKNGEWKKNSKIERKNGMRIVWFMTTAVIVAASSSSNNKKLKYYRKYPVEYYYKDESSSFFMLCHHHHHYHHHMHPMGAYWRGDCCHRRRHRAIAARIRLRQPNYIVPIVISR